MDRRQPIHHAMNLTKLTLGGLELRNATSRQEGQALIEYALIVSLIALVAIAALKTTGTNISGILNKIAGDA
jgi:Flp pilus assembly pilin Flp